jgi:cobalt-zinc-cadmium efflux system protein
MHLDPEHTPAARSRKRLALALVLTAAVMLTELIGGLMSHSLVLLADAGHMLSDAGALGLALFAIWFAARPSPPHRTYGYYRAEILAAVAQAVLLGLVVCFVIFAAVERIRTPPSFAPVPVLLIGGLGLVVNLLGVRLLQSHARGSLTVRGAYLEVLADLFGSVGVIVAR